MQTQSKWLIGLLLVMVGVFVPLFIYVLDTGDEMAGISVSDAISRDNSDIDFPTSEADDGTEQSQQGGKEDMRPLRPTGLMKSIDGFDSLRGIVVWMDGTPCTDAEVSILLLADLRFQLHPDRYESFSTTSGEDGRFFFNAIPMGVYGIMAVKDGYAGHVQTHYRRRSRMGCGDRAYEVVMYPSGSISGQVFGEGGKTLANASVIPYDMANAKQRTDRSGAFSIRHLEVGKYNVLAMAEGYAPRLLKDVLTGTDDLGIQLTKGGSIEGLVTFDGAPLPGISIMACGFMARRYDDYWEMPFVATSDANGHFALSHLPEEEYSIYVTSKTHTSEKIDRLNVTDGEALTGIYLKLKKNTGSVTGRVTDRASGNPLPGIQVRAYAMIQCAFYPLDIVLTDEKGKYSFTSLPIGTIPIAVMGTGQYASAYKLFHNLNEENPDIIIDFQLAGAATIDLMPRDDNGEFVSNADIRQWWKSPDNPNEYVPLSPFPEPFERADGRYTFQGLCPGVYDIEINKRGFTPQEQWVQIETPGENKSLEILLHSTKSVTGKVLDPDGTGVEGAIVECRGQDKCVTDNLGHFRIHGFCSGGSSSGRNTIAVYAEGYKNFRKSYAGEDLEEDHIEIILDAEGTHFLAGKVLNDLHEPLPNLCLTALQKNDSTWQRKSAITDADGQFRIERLTGTPVKLKIPPSRGRIREPQPRYYREVPVDESNMEIIIDRFAEVEGKIFEPSGKPAYATINAWVMHVNSSTTARTQPDGTFHLQKVPPGEVWLNIHADGVGEVKAGPYIIEPGAVLRDVEITVNASGVIKGVVLDAVTREPLSGVQIFHGENLRASKWYLDDHWTKVQSASDGSYTIDNVKPGVLKVAAMLRGYAVGFKTNVVVSKEKITKGVDFLLPRGGEINGRVSDGERAVVSATVSASGPESEYIEETTDTNGNFSLTGLLPGTYHITVSAEFEGTDRYLSKRISIKTGEIKTPLFEFTAGAIVQGKVTRNGEPLPDVMVSFNPKDRNGKSEFSASGKAYSDRNGIYNVEGLHPGLHSLRISQGGEMALQLQKEIEVADGVNVCDLDLDEVGFGRVEGIVTANGSPIKDASVNLRCVNNYEREKTDDMGRFLYEHVSPGTVEIITIYLPEGKSFLQQLRKKWRLDPGEKLKIAIDYPAGTGSISGKLTCNNPPVNERRICAYSETVEGLSFRGLSKQGEFIMDGLPPGPYRVSHTDAWTVSRIVMVENGKTASMHLDYTKGCATLSGAIAAPSNWDDAGVSSITLFKPGKCPWKIGGDMKDAGLDGSLVLTKELYGGGLFNINELPAGAYDAVVTLTREDEILNMKSVPILLNDNETTELNVDLMDR